MKKAAHVVTIEQRGVRKRAIHLWTCPLPPKGRRATGFGRFFGLVQARLNQKDARAILPQKDC